MDLKLINIADRESDNERVVIKVLRSCNLNNYLLFDTTFDEKGIVSNKERHLLVLPNINVNEGDYVWIYSKKGIYGTHRNTSNTVTHKIFWNLDHHIWNNTGDKAYLISYDDWECLLSD